MSDAPPNRISHFRKLRKLSQQQLADAVGGVHWITISKLERGKIKLTEDWLNKLASALNVNEIDLLISQRSLHKIFVDGAIFPGGEVGYEKDGEQEFYTELEIDTDNRGAGFWFVVIGDSFAPYIHSGDIIRATIYENLKIEDCVGRMIHVEIETDGINQYVAILERGSTKGRYNLRRPGAPMIKNVKVTAAHPVTMAIFRGMDIAENG